MSGSFTSGSIPSACSGAHARHFANSPSSRQWSHRSAGSRRDPIRAVKPREAGPDWPQPLPFGRGQPPSHHEPLIVSCVLRRRANRYPLRRTRRSQASLRHGSSGPTSGAVTNARPPTRVRRGCFGLSRAAGGNASDHGRRTKVASGCDRSVEMPDRGQHTVLSSATHDGGTLRGSDIPVH